MAERHSADVAVVGAGPAGIAAATAAAEAGKSVVLIDEGTREGGQIWRHRAGAAPPRARAWIERLERSGARRIPGASAFAISPGFEVLAESDAGTIAVTAPQVVLATGARELFLPFPGWTLPNVLGVGAAQALVKSGLSFAGKRVVLAGSGPLLLAVASTLARGGANVVFVAEQAARAAVLRFGLGLWRTPGMIREAIAYRRGFAGSPYRLGTWIGEARGEDRVREAVLTDGKETWTIVCDYLCAGFGLVPATELARHLGCRIDGGAVAVDDAQRTSVEGVFCAGEPTGIGGVEKALVEGEIAGWTAAGDPRRAADLRPDRRRAASHGRRMERAFLLRPELRSLPRPDTIVCRCEDVSFAEFDPAWSSREAKLCVRAGMGPCQGRVCGPALRYLFGWESDSVRVPISPISVGSLGSIGEQTREVEDGG
jgi:NADPH-dependent 2,4-dienoyl-CoA reductase/sulfur reductase-like enzyme